MSAVTISQNNGNVNLSRSLRRPVCSNVWLTTAMFADMVFADMDFANMLFANMVKPAQKDLGYGAGISHPTQRPLVPM